MFSACNLCQGRLAAASFLRKSSSGLFPLKVLIGFRLLHARCALVRVTGFEPAASWSQTGTENFFRTFPMIFHHFRSYSVTLVPSFEPPFPPVPRVSVVIHVVKNASRQKDGKRFCIYQLTYPKKYCFISEMLPSISQSHS